MKKLEVEYREEVAQLLLGFNVEEVRWHFDGYGDSGEVEDASFSTNGTRVDLGERLSIPIDEESGINLERFLNSMAYYALELARPGWEINDGSYGDIIWDIKEDNIHIDININIMTSTNYTYSM